MLNRLIISLSIALLLVGCSDASDRDTFYSPGVANITVTVQTEQMKVSTDRLITGLQTIRGVRKVNILAKQ